MPDLKEGEFLRRCPREVALWHEVKPVGFGCEVHRGGSGYIFFKMEYQEFHARKLRDDVTWILQMNPGIVVGKGKHGEYVFSDFGGMPYQDWLKGRPFEIGMENRMFTCPAWWYQNADYNKKPNWDECDGTLGSSFSSCPSFVSKEKCWKKWDKQYKNA
jgi:hypothetical protein